MGLILLLAGTSHAEVTDKTLVSWVMLRNRRVRGGSVLTVQDGNRFDGILFTGKGGGRWAAGSDRSMCAQTDAVGTPLETMPAGEMVQMAVVYAVDEIRIYCNGELYIRYTAKNVDLLSSKTNFVVFGLSHFGGEDFISAAIEDARIYGSALSVEDLRRLRPNEPSRIEPYAWWDFEGDEIRDHEGQFVHHNTGEGEDIDLDDGKLILGKYGFLISTRKYIPETPEWPENPPENWLTFHLAHPGPGFAEPGDPNPAFYYEGRYHLHYIYANPAGFAYAHVSSEDMVHWKWHPTVLTPPVTGHGMFSGTGFFTLKGRPAMIYHGVGAGKNFLVYALDKDLDAWTRPEAIEPKDNAGREIGFEDYWDPDCWLNGDTYYAISGGEDPKLMKSTDLRNWEFMGELLHDDFPANLGVTREEDVSCANMFRIGSKWMLLCISHRLGCRYFLGEFKDEKYLPEFHALMNWQDTDEFGFYFAPESMMTKDGRRVMWAWLVSGASPSGVQSLPRELELPDDGVLRIKPLRELKALRYDELNMNNVLVTRDRVKRLSEIRGDALELELHCSAPLPDEFGISLLGDENGKKAMRITMGAGRNTLSVGTIHLPFELKNGEDLILRIYIDKNLVEVFANDRQAAAFAHEHIRDNPNISLFTRDLDLVVKELKAWKMKSIYEGETKFHYIKPDTER
jgi:sucrose-6-phosphate hydrolase SacC (GH32 family)